MARSNTADELGQLVAGLLKPSALIELAVIFGCLLAGWGVLRLWRGPARDEDSVWFGRRIVDGVLFPLLSLLLALLARWLLA